LAYGGLFNISGGATGLPCLWKLLFGFECPACGMSRAWAFFLRGDMASALHANWLLFPTIMVFAYHSIVFSFRVNEARLLASALKIQQLG